MLRAVVLVLCLVVFIFAVVQSVFGVGLLVFARISDLVGVTYR